MLEKLKQDIQAYREAKENCPFSKSRCPPVSKPCPKCNATSSEPCRKQVNAALTLAEAAIHVS